MIFDHAKPKVQATWQELHHVHGGHLAKQIEPRYFCWKVKRGTVEHNMRKSHVKNFRALNGHHRVPIKNANFVACRHGIASDNDGSPYGGALN